MLHHLLQLVEDLGVEEIRQPSLGIDVVFGSLQPSISNCFGLAAGPVVDLHEELRRDKLDVTPARRNACVV